jgi:WD40 repeat protein
MNYKRDKYIDDISINHNLPKSSFPSDSVTQTSWLDNNIFGISSFDGHFRLYEVYLMNHNSSFNMVFDFKYDFPIINFTFIHETTYIALGTCDGNVIIIDFKSKANSMNQNLNVLHQFKYPVMKLFYINENNSLLCVDSMKNVALFDMNSMRVNSEFQTELQIMDADFEFPWLVLALADNYVEFINLQSPRR